MFQNEQDLYVIVHQIGPCVLNMRLDLERMNFSVHALKRQQDQKIADLEKGFAERINELEKTWTDRFNGIDQRIDAMMNGLRTQGDSIQHMKNQTDTCARNWADFSQLHILDWKNKCEHTQNFQAHFSEMLPTIQDALVRADFLPSEGERIENKMADMFYTAMNEIQRVE